MKTEKSYVKGITRCADTIQNGVGKPWLGRLHHIADGRHGALDLAKRLHGFDALQPFLSINSIL